MSKKVNINKYQFRDFKPLWKVLRSRMVERDLELFYDVIAIDSTVGRRFYPGCGREDNPRFYSHWFALGRCHWNVILPCFMLNDGEFCGDFKVLISEKHSVILNSESGVFYCPTINDEESARNMLKNCKKIELFEHLPSVVIRIENFKKFVKKYMNYEKM